MGGFRESEFKGGGYSKCFRKASVKGFYPKAPKRILGLLGEVYGLGG